MDLKTILVVEDDPDTLQLLESKLVEKGFAVASTHLGEEAIEKARKVRPDLILMDILLPDIEGSEVVRTLNDLPQTAEIPVIFLSGIVGTSQPSEQCEVLVGSRRYQAIPKPFTFKVLLDTIRRTMESAHLGKT